MMFELRDLASRPPSASAATGDRTTHIDAIEAFEKDPTPDHRDDR